MSGPLVLAIAAAGPAFAAPLVYDQAVSVALPSLDTGRGIDASYERWLPDRRMSIAVSGELRESAIGDYTGVRIGTGVELRWFWRADRDRAWLSTIPRGNIVGWFLGAGALVATDLTHDDTDHRWLGTALQAGITGGVGYRIAPWRQLIITPSAGLEAHVDIDTSGRLPTWMRGWVGFGLDVGWLF